MWIFLLYLQRCHRISPQVFIAAEWDQHLRAIVADALGLSLDNNWRVNKFQSKSIYVSDVDDLFSNDALILRQLYLFSHRIAEFSSLAAALVLS